MLDFINNIKEKIRFALSELMADSYDKMQRADETREAKKLAKEENIEFLSVEGCQCEYLECTRPASMEIEDKSLCGHHAMQFILFLISDRGGKKD